MDQDQVQALVQAAVAAALAKHAGVPPEGAQPPVPPVFARCPAQAHKGIINYGTIKGMELYNAAIKPLATKYNGKPLGFHTFLVNVDNKGREYDWSDIITIPIINPAGKPESRNLIDRYGSITLADIRAHATVYDNQASINAQNASQMYTFLYGESLSNEAKLMVFMDEDDYTITTNDGTQVRKGPAFLKVIIRNTR